MPFMIPILGKNASFVLILLSCCLRSTEASIPKSILTAKNNPSFVPVQKLVHNDQGSSIYLKLRGGNIEELSSSETSPETSKSIMNEISNIVSPLSQLAQTFGKTYSNHLDHSPILTKSITASFIFGLSDYTAQKLEQKSSKENEIKVDMGRVLTASLVGLLYFGAAAHTWYSMIFKILPGTSLASTLQKAMLGQLLFGPSFTCIFFATALIHTNSFTLGNWFEKIRRDLPGAWKAVSNYFFFPFVSL